MLIKKKKIFFILFTPKQKEEKILDFPPHIRSKSLKFRNITIDKSIKLKQRTQKKKQYNKLTNGLDME